MLGNGQVVTWMSAVKLIARKYVRSDRQRTRFVERAVGEAEEQFSVFLYIDGNHLTLNSVPTNDNDKAIGASEARFGSSKQLFPGRE